MTQNLTYTRKEYMEFLSMELFEYEVGIGDMTEDEREELRKWVDDGGSPYDNPWGYCRESGHTMDYLMASRIISDMWDNPDDYSWGPWEESDDLDDDIPF